jgi:hypothetical protein
VERGESLPAGSFAVATDVKYSDGKLKKRYALVEDFWDLFRFHQVTRLNPYTQVFYEYVEAGRPCHFFVDFDGDGLEFEEGWGHMTEFLNALQVFLEERCGLEVNPAKHFRLYNSSRPGKTSFHFVLQGFHLQDVQDGELLLHYLLTSLSEEAKKAFDTLIYSKGRQFRLLGSHKMGKVESVKKC